MLNFAAKHFRKFIEISLWLNLIVCVIVGYQLGGNSGAHNSGDHRVIGLILGIIAGLLINIICGGLLAVFLNISKDVKNLNKWLQCVWQNSNSIKTGAKIESIDDDDIYYFDYTGNFDQARGNEGNADKVGKAVSTDFLK